MRDDVGTAPDREQRESNPTRQYLIGLLDTWGPLYDQLQDVADFGLFTEVFGADE